MTAHSQPAFIDVRDYGVRCDGAADDTLGFGKAIAAATATGATTREIVIPAGVCIANIVLTEVRYLRFRGMANRGSTVITNKTADPVLIVNGMWYSTFESIEFRGNGVTAGRGVVEIDGNHDGVHTLRVQANTFKDCLFNGNDSCTYALTMGVLGGGGAQGSENLFLNCHFASVLETCYVQSGFNALNNTFIGGNFQRYPKHGIYLIGGAVQLFSVGFQSTYQYDQVTNGGFDISAAQAGAHDRISVHGCRTESLQFYYGGVSQGGDIRAVTQNAQTTGYASDFTYPVGAICVQVGVDGINHLYRVTTAGTTGSSPPTWPNSGTVTDGTAVWTESFVQFAYLPRGEFSYRNSYVNVGKVNAKLTQYAEYSIVSTTYTTRRWDQWLNADASGGAFTITLNSENLITTEESGQTITITKTETSTNAVTISGAVDGDVVLPGGGRSSVTFAKAQGNDTVWRWYKISPSDVPIITKTITVGGTTGDRTINKAAGCVNAAALSTSLVVTNSLVTTSSIILLSVQTADLTLFYVRPVAGSGSFTLNYPSATAETKICFVIF